MADDYGQSPQWARITSTLITEDAIADMSNFKSSGINYKMALWDPRPNGVRYLKDLIFNLGSQLSQANRVRLRRIHNREVGNPITVRCDGDALCIDYLQAVYEIEFMSSAVELDHMNVLEIGAGYGRTCHALMSNHSIETYTIIDLPNSLEVARRYLSAVLDGGQFSRMVFIANDDAASLPEAARYDLCININSFGEMTADVVRNYLRLVAGRCQHFYTKNQVGKYLDKSLDGHSQGDDVVTLALSTGLLRDIIDIYDSDAVRAERVKFIDAHRPGPDWVRIADGWAMPWSFYWQVMYHRGAA